MCPFQFRLQHLSCGTRHIRLQGVELRGLEAVIPAAVQQQLEVVELQQVAEGPLALGPGEGREEDHRPTAAIPLGKQRSHTSHT